MSEEKNAEKSGKTIKTNAIGILKYHTEDITSITVPIYEVNFDVFTASRDKKVVGWTITKDTENDILVGVPKRLYTGHSHIIEECKLSSGGGYILTASWDKTARIMDISGEEKSIVLQGHKGDVLTIAVSEEPNTWVVTGSRDGNIRIWTVEGDCVGEKKITDEWVTASMFAQLSTVGPVVIVGTSDSMLQVYKKDENLDMIMDYRGHTRSITAISPSPCPFIFVSGDADGNVILWNLETGKGEATGKVDGEIYDMSVHHIKKWIAISAGSKIYLWDLETNPTSCILTVLVDAKQFLKSNYAIFRSIKWSVDGNHLYAGCSNGDVYIFSVKDED